MLEKDSAICIRTVDYSETSQIATFFTKSNGKISVIAKGSKRPKSAFDGPLEVFSFGRIAFSSAAQTERKLATLTEFQQQRFAFFLNSNLYAMNCGFFVAELIDKFTDEYDPHPLLFDTLANLLQNISESADKNTILMSLILFQLNLLKEIGLQPVLNLCVNCKTRCEMRDTKDEFYFSSSANGLVCRDCESAFPDRVHLSTKAVNVITDLKKLAIADEKTLGEIEKLLIYHFTEISGYTPKMAKHILKF